MKQVSDFVDKYFKGYLKRCRSDPSKGVHIPPTAQELCDLMSYLQEEGVDPVIVGSAAIIKHLNPSRLSDDKFRLTQDIDIFISNVLPDPPAGWRRDSKSIGVNSWISPTGGYVDFLLAGQPLPDNHRIPSRIGKDSESSDMGCPVADVVSIFLMKLNSYRDKDLTDLVLLARKVGIPKSLRTGRLSREQRDNLNLVEIWKDSPE